MPLRFAFALLLGLLSCSAAAEDAWVDLEDRFSAEQRRATGLDTLTPEQLAALNALLRDDTTAKVVVAREEARAQAAAETRAAIAAQPRDPGRMIGHADGPVSARVQGTLTGWQPGHEFVLDNGQVWKVLKGEMTLREPLQDPQILVVPGIAGRWFLQVHEDLPKARVYRID